MPTSRRIPLDSALVRLAVGPPWRQALASGNLFNVVALIKRFLEEYHLAVVASPRLRASPAAPEASEEEEWGRYQDQEVREARMAMDMAEGDLEDLEAGLQDQACQAELVQAASEATRISPEDVVEEDLRHRRRLMEGRPLLLSPAMVLRSAT